MMHTQLQLLRPATALLCSMPCHPNKVKQVKHFKEEKVSINITREKKYYVKTTTKQTVHQEETRLFRIVLSFNTIIPKFEMIKLCTSLKFCSYLVTTMDFQLLLSAPSSCGPLLSANCNLLPVSSSWTVIFSFNISKLFFAIRNFSAASVSYH